MAKNLPISTPKKCGNNKTAANEPRDKEKAKPKNKFRFQFSWNRFRSRLSTGEWVAFGVDSYVIIWVWSDIITCTVPKRLIFLCFSLYVAHGVACYYFFKLLELIPPWAWPMIAIFGGVIVFWGLWIEHDGGNSFSNVNDFRRHFWKVKWGWRVLMIGIGAEIVLGLVAAGKDVVAWSVANAKLQDRMITETQRTNFINFLRNAPKGPVRMMVGNLPLETRNYADAIHDMLFDAGYPTPNKIEKQEKHPDFLPNFASETSVAIISHSAFVRPVYGDFIYAAFTNIHINTVRCSFRDTSIDPNGGCYEIRVM